MLDGIEEFGVRVGHFWGVGVVAVGGQGGVRTFL